MKWQSTARQVLDPMTVCAHGPLRITLIDQADGRQFVSASVTMSHFDDRQREQLQREVVGEFVDWLRATADKLSEELCQ